MVTGTSASGSGFTAFAVFRAESSDKIVTHKPFALEICIRENGVVKQYTIPTKISERKVCCSLHLHLQLRR
jgi:hypothetical protein